MTIKELTDTDFIFFEVDGSGALKPVEDLRTTSAGNKFGIHHGSNKHESRLVVYKNHVPHTQALVLVKSDYCPHCVRAKALIQELDNQMSGGFPIYVIDTAENDMLMESLKVEFVPTYFFVTADGIVDPKPHSFRNAEEMVQEIIERSGLAPSV